MIKLVAVESRSGYSLLLRFSDGAWGEFDFTPFVATHTEMTSPLADPAFFRRHFIELGALAWPNGFDLSAESLYRRLEEAGRLKHEAEAA
jgi:hypothetical protein